MATEEVSSNEAPDVHPGLQTPMSPNRVTLLTAPGSSAIAVIRLSGPGVDAFLARRFSKPVALDRCVHGLLRDGDRVIDDAIAVRSAGFVDLNLHGGNWVVRSALRLAQADGFELCDLIPDPQQSEIWQEVLAALPLAKTETAVRMLLAQPAAWEKLPAGLGEIQKIIDDPSGRWLIALPTVAIAGPPNVGKSTLANQLFGQVRSITADLPGTTRDWVGEIANIDGLAVLLLDTPGQRATDDPIESAAIAASSPRIKAAEVVVLVLDQTQPLDGEMIAAHANAIIVANKSDLGRQWSAAEIGAIETVATEGYGLDLLREEIRRRLGIESMTIERARWWTPRQRDLLRGRLG